MKRTILGLCIALAAVLLAGCGPHADTVTNGGIPPASVGQTGVLSANGRAQTGSITIINIADAMAARKGKQGGGGQYIPPQYRHPQQ